MREKEEDGFGEERMREKEEEKDRFREEITG